jgi:hypothetical protein
LRRIGFHQGYRANPAPHDFEHRARANGEHWRIFDSIRRVDEDGNIYDGVAMTLQGQLNFANKQVRDC